ncbi:MAG: endolytic transglycosylase MltG [Bacteroidota bacterium]
MWRKLLGFLVIAAIVAGILGYQKYLEIYSPNVADQLDDPYLVIPTGSSFEDVLQRLTEKNFLIDSSSFVWVAEQMKYKREKMRAGRFQIKPSWSNRRLISHLRGGKQAPVRVTLTNERLPEEIAGKVAKKIEADSMDILQLFRDERFLEQNGYDQEDIRTLIIPNTYEFFWNSTAQQFFDRMKKEHDKFWGKEGRRSKAKRLNLSPGEVYILASIVERETNRQDEKARIAGVYYNRLQKGMLLQADPTVVFATRDFQTRRVLNRHLEVESPYNTYKYKGLPPGPISLSAIPTIDAVLNVEDHDYIFFCAKGDGSGYHAFAKTLSGHNANAARYRANLKQRGKR